MERGGRRNVRGNGLRHSLRVGSERKGSRSQFPVTELEMRLGNGSKKQEEGCGFTFSLLWLAEDASSYWEMDRITLQEGGKELMICDIHWGCGQQGGKAAAAVLLQYYRGDRGSGLGKQ